MAAFIVSSFGLFVMSLFAGLFTAPSWQTFTVLAWGWAVASGERQTITTYLWLTGATTVKHFSRFYAFLGGALYQARWQLWARIIRCAAQWVPAEAPIVLIVDDSTKKKAGRQIEGVGHYRNGAGSARQEYRTLRGLNFVWGIMRVPVPRLAGPLCQCPHRLVALPQRGTSAQAQASLSVPQCPGPRDRGLCRGPTPRRGRFASWAMAAMPPRTTCNSYPPRSTWSRACSSRASSMRCRRSRAAPRRGCPPKKGPLLGSPKTLARKRRGWQPHPTEAGALVQAWDGAVACRACRDG